MQEQFSYYFLETFYFHFKFREILESSKSFIWQRQIYFK